jgi:hypothetical protein
VSDRAFDSVRPGSPKSSDVAPARPTAPERSLAAGHELLAVVGRRATAPQGEIELGRTDDPQEREADLVAERVMGMSAPGPLRRTCACGGTPGPDGECARCRAARLALQRDAEGTAGSTVAPPIVHRVLGSAGAPLDGATRAFFEPRFGTDLSDVRVHRDAQAAASAEAVGASAYAVGSDVVFAEGRHTPGTTSGRRLLAHELAHVLQQRGAGSGQQLARQPEPSLEQRVTELERRQNVSEAKTASKAQDDRWRSEFDDRFSSWTLATLRISGALKLAQQGFTRAQVDQAEVDALVVQVLLAAVTIGFAQGFEPLLSGGLERLGKTADQIKNTVEAWENPAVGVVGAAASMAPAAQAALTATPVAEPTPEVASQDPFAFFLANTAALEQERRKVEQAFSARGKQRDGATDEQALTFDLEGQERVFSELFARVKSTSRGVEDLKSEPDLTSVFERHLWAQWLRGRGMQIFHGSSPEVSPVTEAPTEDLRRGIQPTTYHSGVQGFYICTELTAAGVTSQAGVTLNCHWWAVSEWQQSDDWERKLLAWAWSYDENLSISSGLRP